MAALHFNSIDLTGQTFNRWSVIGYAGKSYWLCRCECGTEKAVATANLPSGKSKSCGCLRDEIVSVTSATHRLTKSDEYKVWAGIKRRCLNTHEACYPDYGGRGITICQRWSDSFEAFLEDMGKRPSSKYSIDRINNEKGYEPGNCRWATRSDQNRNTRRNVILTFNGKTMTVAEWGRETGINRSTIQFRLYSGWDVERTLTTPAVYGRNQFSHGSQI